MSPATAGEGAYPGGPGGRGPEGAYPGDPGGRDDDRGEGGPDDGGQDDEARAEFEWGTGFVVIKTI